MAPGVVKAPDRITLFDEGGNRGGSGDGVRSCRRLFCGEVDGGARGRGGVVASVKVTAGSML